MNNKYNSKHLSLADRIKIEKCIVDGFRKFKTAREINKSPATVAKEIFKNRKTRARDSFNTANNQCIYIKDCGVCNIKCSEYTENKCYRRDRFIGACNNCPEIKGCKLIKYYYSAKQSNDNYLYNLKDAREGVNLTTTELLSIVRIIKPLIEQGQSIYTILENHKEISLSVKTLYTYIEIGLFNDWGINNLSLKRKVKRKIRSKKLKKRSEPTDYSGRKYEDYLEFIKLNPNISTTEMDTVYNSHSGPFIQTFIFQNTGLMIGRLHSLKNVESMSSSFDIFQEILGSDYHKLFSLILTDRGSEFAKPRIFEINSETGELRTNIFYCDPQTPSQKPHVENNHNFVREILPNGMNWYHLNQEKVDEVFSHINSVPRKSLGGKTPYEAFSFFYGEEILNKLNIQKIQKDKVTLQPYLIKI
jgi:IS30 family transposase